MKKWFLVTFVAGFSGIGGAWVFQKFNPKNSGVES